MAKVSNTIRTMQFWYPNIPRKLVIADGLSIQAKFVYIYMSCQPESFDFFHEPMSKALGIGTRTLSKYISELIESGWITNNGQKFEKGRKGAIDYIINTSPKKVKNENTDVQKSASSNTDVSNCAPKYNSNTSIPITYDSNTSIPIKEDNKEVDNKLSPNNMGKSSRFKKPTVEEIAAYIKEKGYDIDAEYFFNYYESVAWKRGNTPMKNWKSTLSTWHLKSKDKKEEKEEMPAGMTREQWSDIQDWMGKKIPRIKDRITPELFLSFKPLVRFKSKLLSHILQDINNSDYEGDILAEFERISGTEEYLKQILNDEDTAY